MFFFFCLFIYQFINNNKSGQFQCFFGGGSSGKLSIILAKASFRAEVCFCWVWDGFRVKIAGVVDWKAEVIFIADWRVGGLVAGPLAIAPAGGPVSREFTGSALVQSKTSSFLNRSRM